jgi:carboxymethylenebutenolidase
MTEQNKPSKYSHEVFNLYDEYAHGGISRREFIERAGKFGVGLSGAALLEALSPNYARAEQVAKDDPRLKSGYVDYPSPKGYGNVHAYISRPANPKGKLPGVVVGHEAGGLNPYTEDVVRRLALLDFIALGPDALTSIGGNKGDQELGLKLQSKMDRAKMTEDFGAGVALLQADPGCSGKVAMVGFCFGGGVATQLTIQMPSMVAAVSYYGREPATEDVAKIKVPLLLHYAEIDNSANPGWPAFEAALKANHVNYTAYSYPGTHHAFHNDSTPRYDEAAATLSWKRTVDFLNMYLR